MKGNTVLLVLILLALGGSLFLSYTNLQQIQLLRQENTTLWVKLDSVQQIVNKKPVKQKAAPAATKSTGNAFLDLLIQMEEESEKQAAAERAKQKVTLSTKYRLEDRYVSYGINEPDLLGDQAGEVVLDIYVDHSGDVKSAKLKSSTGVTNEEVIEACKKAALKTNFNYNYDAPDNQQGTITYIFTAKK
jgi:TonB family protein